MFSIHVLACVILIANYDPVKAKNITTDIGPAWGPFRNDIVKGYDKLDWSRDASRVVSTVYNPGYPNWPYHLTGQLEGQELLAGVIREGEKVIPMSKATFEYCSPRDYKMKTMDKYTAEAIKDWKQNGIVFEQELTQEALSSCPKRTSCTYKIAQWASGYINGEINGKEASKVERALDQYGPLALWMSDLIRDNLEERSPFLRIVGWVGAARYGVLLVGYGRTDEGIDYFKFKNARGSAWGDKGFGYIRRCPQPSVAPCTCLHGTIILYQIEACRK